LNRGIVPFIQESPRPAYVSVVEAYPFLVKIRIRIIANLSPGGSYLSKDRILLEMDLKASVKYKACTY